MRDLLPPVRSSGALHTRSFSRHLARRRARVSLRYSSKKMERSISTIPTHSSDRLQAILSLAAETAPDTKRSFGYSRGVAPEFPEQAAGSRCGLTARATA